MSCLFCRIVNGEIPSRKVYEDEHVLAFHDIAPQAPVHILIIPKKHYSTILDINESDKELIGHIFLVAKRIAKEMAFDEKGFRVVVNCNSEGGQTVFHLHFHLLAGRVMHWPPG
ncbi:histidine triad nucleotide-binding protein [Thermodesulfovibrio sp.]|jgi:histidine triad (HIT) family protein|uniref:histidine triad nucleotide-binding protein n=1 Tax=Thermodesulfovibrio TaxID=28261 RepID=UPI00262F8C85|nr:histidine triad nucleotide-binding protein [Thermodesulfovibrio sp.]